MSQKVPCNAPACYHFQKAGHPFSCQVFTAANECREKWAQVLGIRMRGRHLPLHLCSCHFPPTHLSWNGDGWNLSLYAMPSTRLFTHTRPLISAISACAASTTTTHSGVTVPQPHSASHSLCVPLVTGTETSPALCIPIVAGERRKHFCSVSGCGHFQQAGHTDSCKVFHARDKRRDAWISVLSPMRGKGKQISVCQCHFSSDDITISDTGIMLAPDALPVTSRQLTAQPTETHNSLLADMIAGPAITSDVTDEQYPHNYKQTGVTGNPETRIPEICSQTDYAIVNSLTVRRKSRKFCLAPGCKHIAVPGNPLSCRLFYAKSERKDVWLSKLGLKNKCKVVCICKCHFRVSDFSRMHGKLTLDPSAVPVITSSDRLTAANDHIAKLEKELACTKQVLEKIRSHLTECQVASMMGKPVTKWNEEDLEIGSKIRKKVTTTAYDLIRSFLPLPSIGSLNAHYNKKRRRLEENSQPEADHESGGQSMPHETHTLSPADMDLMTAAVRATQC